METPRVNELSDEAFGEVFEPLFDLLFVWGNRIGEAQAYQIALRFLLDYDKGLEQIARANYISRSY